jgi:hypothetical protein
MGVVHKFSPDWGSHIPVLIKCLELTDKDDVKHIFHNSIDK